MDDEYQAYMTQDLNAVMNLGNLLGNSGEGDPTGGYGGMPPDYTVNDPIGPDLPITNPPPAVDPNDPIGPDLPPDNPRDAVDPNDPLVGGTPPKTDTPPQIPTDLKNLLRGLIVGDDGKANPMGLFGIMALLSMMRGSGAPAAVGYRCQRILIGVLAQAVVGTFQTLNMCQRHLLLRILAFKQRALRLKNRLKR